MGTSIGLLILGIVLGVLAGGLRRARCPGLTPRRRRPRPSASASPRLPSRARKPIRREAQVEAREQALKLRAELEQELREKRSEIGKIEERVITKEEDIDRKLTEIERREQGILDREGAPQAAPGGARRPRRTSS